MELQEKLANVRRATRLLAAYNRRVISVLRLVNQTAEGAQKLSLTFLRWDPTYHSPIGKQTTAPFERWGWDFLPLGFSWFRWTTKGEAKPAGPGSVMLCVWHEIDEAYQRSDDASEPDPSVFDPAQDSKSQIYVWVLAIKSGAVTDDWSAVVRATESAFDPPAQVDGVVKDVPIGALPGAVAGTVIRFVGRVVPIEDITDETQVDLLVLQPLRQSFIEIFK